MSFDVANSETYRTLLDVEIRRHATRPVTLLIVKDIAEWAAEGERSVDGNPPATAGFDRETGDWGIVLRQSIDREWVESILSRVEVRFPDTRSALSTPVRFLQHLVLHELAHIENGWGQEREDDCDAWAFGKLMQSNNTFERDAPQAARPSP